MDPNTADSNISSDECSEDLEMDLDTECIDEENLMNDDETESDLQTMLFDLFTEHKKDRNIVDVLLEIKRQLEVSNRIQMELLSLKKNSVTPSPSRT
jgi:hypothetical protein